MKNTTLYGKAFGRQRQKVILLAIIVLLIISLVFSSCKRPTETRPSYVDYTYHVPDQTNDGWETAHLSDVNISEVPLVWMMREYFGTRTRDVHGILIIKDRKLVFEEYFPGYDYGPGNAGWRGPYLYFNKDTLHCLHSATKSFTSAMLGIAIDKGFLPDENERMFSYFPEYSHLWDAQKDKITLKHLLTMTSGLEWNEGDIPLTDEQNDLIRLIRSSDPIGYILGKPVVSEPGTTYYYSGGDTNLVGAVIHKTTGLNVDLLSREHLFAHLGITNFSWLYFPYNNNVVYCSGDIYMRPRDMAKFGQLFLDGGVWDGERIISEEWVLRSTSQHFTFDQAWNADGYGYQWWIFDYYVSSSNQYVHSYSARGWGGQDIIVLPQLNTVVVLTGGNYNVYPPDHDIVRQYILPAIL
jgi:CubicO group peptidase (beta-lactamase class C family)